MTLYSIDGSGIAENDDAELAGSLVRAIDNYTSSESSFAENQLPALFPKWQSM